MAVVCRILALGLCISLAGPVMADVAKQADVAKGIATLEAGDVKGAVATFLAAFEADGAFYLGRLFEMGLGTDKDMRRGAELYAAAVSRGSALAQNRLGLMYVNGEVLLQDYKLASQLICAAADQGDANGQFNCGLLYSEGKAVRQDPARAVAYWQKAASAHHVAAINYLGQAYQTGTGIGQDVRAAFEQFSKTAKAGNPMGLHELAKAYATGTGVEQDLVKAHGHANLAAARVLRDEIFAKLDATSLGTAQAFARDFKAVAIDKAE